MTIRVTNPSNESVVRSFDLLSDSKLDAHLESAVLGAQTMRSTSVDERARILLAAADIVEKNIDQLARLATEEMGKPIARAEAEVAKCAAVCRFYAGNGPDFLADEPIETERNTFKKFLPIGPVLAIMPWNFPFWQVFRFAAPALMAGNVCLLKHAQNVAGCAQEIERIFTEAGAPVGVFQNLFVSHGQVEKIISDPRVRGVTLTGSGRAGSIIGAQAGRAVKPCVLELGANDGFIVMPSADMDAAIEAAVKARTQNNGQSCIAGKRFFVHQDIYSEFRDKFVAAFEALKVGDPMDRSVDIGPIATQSGLRELGEQVSQAEKVGAHTLIGAKEIDGPGFFFQPGILDNVACNSPMCREEVFGPVAALIEATNLTDAIRKCNNSYYGLGSVLFTQDEGEMARACEEIESGATFINQMVVSDPRLPFGGVKESGIGRELGVEGMRAFQNTKTISRPV